MYEGIQTGKLAEGKVVVATTITIHIGSTSHKDFIDFKFYKDITSRRQ